MDNAKRSVADRDGWPTWLGAARVASLLYGLWLLANAAWWATLLKEDGRLTALLALPVVLLWLARRRFALAFGLWLLATAAFWGFNTSDPGDFLLILYVGVPLLPLWIAFIVAAIIVAIVRWRRGARWGAAIAGLVPLLAVAAVFEGGYVADVAHFRIMRADYVAAIAAARAEHPVPDMRVEIGPPTFAYFRWGGMVFGSAGIAYDETDEAGRPAEARSDTWRARHQNSEFACDPDVRALGGHFYLLHAGC